jgi:hypothetical protein
MFLQTDEWQYRYVDLHMSETVSDASVTAPSKAFNFTFTVWNLGAIEVIKDLTAYNVTVIDTFPVGIAPTTKYWIQPEAPGDGESHHLCSQSMAVAHSVMHDAHVPLRHCLMLVSNNVLENPASA